MMTFTGSSSAAVPSGHGKHAVQQATIEHCTCDFPRPGRPVVSSCEPRSRCPCHNQCNSCGLTSLPRTRTNRLGLGVVGSGGCPDGCSVLLDTLDALVPVLASLLLSFDLSTMRPLRIENPTLPMSLATSIASLMRRSANVLGMK